VGLWLRQARASQRAHYELGSTLAHQNALLTATVVVSSTVVGSSLFGLLAKSPGVWWKLGLALASAASAVLLAVQRSLNLADKAERHRASGSNWQRVLNKASAASTYPPGSKRLLTAVDELEKMIDEVVASSPQIPEKKFLAVGLKSIYDELEKSAQEM
jgi:ABC-type cobalamin transport system ATPase subunit